MRGDVSRCKIAVSLRRIDLRRIQTWWAKVVITSADRRESVLNSDRVCRTKNATCIEQPTIAPRCDIGIEITTPHSAVYTQISQGVGRMRQTVVFLKLIRVDMAGK